MPIQSNNFAFLTLSLSFSSPPWHLKVPINNPGRGGGGRYTAVKGMVCKQCGLGQRIKIRELGSKIEYHFPGN